MGRAFFHAYLSDVGETRIGEVKCIKEVSGGVLFVAAAALVVVKDGVTKIVDMDCQLSGAFEWNGRLVFRKEGGGLLVFEDGKFCSYQESLFSKTECRVTCELKDGRVAVGTGTGVWTLSEEKFVKVEWPELSGDVPVNDIFETGDGTVVVATATDGVVFTDEHFRILCRMDETNGLCSNTVNGLVTDEKGTLWCATAKGISAVGLSSMYSKFTDREGLPGEVLCVQRYAGRLYVGTYQGLYCLDTLSHRFVAVNGITQACWQLRSDKKGRLWAATGGGLFLIDSGNVAALNRHFALCVLVDSKSPLRVYTGETDGIYLNCTDGGRRCLLASVGQVSDLVADTLGNIWVMTLYGEIFCYRDADLGEEKALRSVSGLEAGLGNRLVWYQGDVMVVSGRGFYRYDVRGDTFISFSLLKDSVSDSWWPGIAREDRKGDLWITGGDGRGMSVWRNGCRVEGYNRRLTALEDYQIRVIYQESPRIAWLGGSFGLIRVDMEKRDPSFDLKGTVFVREEGMVVGKSRDAFFSFVSDASGLIKPVRYACRLGGFEQNWSVWSVDNWMLYNRLPYGKYYFEVKSLDVFGRESFPVRVDFEIVYPFYLKWYAWGVYLVVFLLLGRLFFEWRTRQLLSEKVRLEGVVEQRSLEIRLQRDEIHEKSCRLEQTLDTKLAFSLLSEK